MLLISTDIRKGSWSNQVGAWQWYIHGNASTDKYLGLSPDHKNPADTSDAQGVRITIVGHIPSSRELEADNSQDGTSFWNGQDMERSELIPSTKADLGSGHLFYHFSLKTKETNAPNPAFEHQIAFFEVTTPCPMHCKKATANMYIHHRAISQSSSTALRAVLRAKTTPSAGVLMETLTGKLS